MFCFYIKYLLSLKFFRTLQAIVNFYRIQCSNYVVPEKSQKALVKYLLSLKSFRTSRATENFHRENVPILSFWREVKKHRV